MTTDQRAPGMVELDQPAARAAMRSCEKLAPRVGVPLDYDDCLLFGLWRRLDAGERSIPAVALRALEDRSRNPAPQGYARDRAPERVVSEAEASRLLAGIILARMVGLLGGRPENAIRREEQLLIGEGLTLALLMPRVRFAGYRLLDYIQRLEAPAVG